MSTSEKPLSVEEAVNPVFGEPAAEVRLWQAQKIKAGLKAADEGRFASPAAVSAVVAKFVPNG